MEQLAGISAKKKKAREFQEERAGSGPKRAFRDDNQDKIIPEHGRRGRGRLLAFNRSISPDVRRTSSGFSADLAKSAFSSFPRDETAGVVVNDITVDFTGMPVILDTNVVVAGLFSLWTGSPSRRLMELALADGEEIVPCVTTAIVYEYKRILEMFGDDHLENLYRLLFRSIVIPLLPDIETLPVRADYSDTPFVQALLLTMSGSAGNQRPLSRLATNDHHLLDMVKGGDLAELLFGRIITPGDLLRELKR